ncbi:MAG: hypothetical protein A4E23_01450 [Methanomethylovorans sp. PtaU1.Bin073]|nr:MAG: hypothetical protein A4E23_01450 [Methanomethylovorans sp. PtaU1.Bin073]
MYWDWNKTFGGMIRFGLMLLSFSFVVQNELILNDAFLPQIPVGLILVVIVGILISRHTYRTLKWYSACFKRKRYQFNVFVHFCLYLIVFSIALSIPVTLGTTSSTQENLLQNIGYNDVVHTVAETLTTTESITPDISSFKTNPKTEDYRYVLRGVHGNLTYTVYGGLNDYLKGLPRSISYYTTPPTEIDFINRDLNEEYQKQLLDPLVEEIKNITPNKDDQARIAISLVQNINYDTDAFMFSNIEGKYPYEVLYTGSGVCSEKSELLAYLLRGLGYEVVIFRFDVENHDAIGIKCPEQYSYRDTGYCFVESTSPSIITDASGDYVGVGKLTTMPKILKICDGSSLDSVYEEYNDNITFYELYNKMNSYPSTTLSQSDYNEWKSYSDEWQKLVNKYGIEVIYLN